MPEIGTSGLMSGDGKRGDGLRPPSYRAHPQLYPATVLAVGLPAQRAIAQRFSALAHSVIPLRCGI